MRLIDATLLKKQFIHSEQAYLSVDKICKWIDEAPTERKKAKWICDDILHCKYHCSECRSDGINIQPFCAWCGSEMRGNKNEREQ